MAGVLCAMAGDPDPARAQAAITPARDSLLAILPRLTPSAQKEARHYLAEPDSTKRRTALRALTEHAGPPGSSHDSKPRRDSSLLSTDSLAFQFYRIAGLTDPWPPFRLTAASDLIQKSDISPDAKRHYLAEVIEKDPDSSVVFRAVDLLHWLARDSTGTAALRRRLKDGDPDLRRSWVAQAHQRARNRQQDVALPLFMFEAPPVFAAAPAATSLVRFFALGDWGEYNGEPQQSVSRAVRAAHDRAPFHFGLTLGDNFYEDGIESPYSSRWQLDYEQHYGVLGIPVYGVLGNHDFQGSDSPAAEILYSRYSRTWRMPATHYSFTAGPAQFFIVDTENLTPWHLGWLDSALAASQARWKIVAGHYDLYSNREDGSRRAAQLLVPLLRRHRVAAYLNGHYHTLQHYQVDGIDYLTSGAGGRKTLYDIDTTKVESARKYAAKRHGFAVLEVTPSTMAVEFRDSAGAVLYGYQRRQ